MSIDPKCPQCKGINPFKDKDAIYCGLCQTDAIKATNEQPVELPEMYQQSITICWKDIKPCHQAQNIRSKLAFELDPDDILPDAVWDILDIGVQMGINQGASEREAAQPDDSPAFDIQNCQFIGGNPLDYVATDDGFLKIKSVTMKGWTCYAPDCKPEREAVCRTCEKAENELCSDSFHLRESEASELAAAVKILRDVNEVMMDAGDDWWYGVHYKEASDLLDSYDNRRRDIGEKS